MATLLTCAVIASMAGLIVPPTFKIMSMDRNGRMELRGGRTAFAPE
ncbi:hypothetical protein AB8841_18655 [Microvirga sp. TS319]